MFIAGCDRKLRTDNTAERLIYIWSIKIPGYGVRTGGGVIKVPPTVLRCLECKGLDEPGQVVWSVVQGIQLTSY